MNTCPGCLSEYADGVCGSCGYRDNVVPKGSLPSGALLKAGRYRVDRFLAAGGMGSVYLAHDSSLGRRCVLKEMHDSGSPADLELRVVQFRKEAQILANLNHTHIVNLWDFFEESGRFYLAEEFLEGGDLSKAALPLSEQEAIAIAVPIARALAYLHGQNIVYRDLKPANVLLRADGTVVLADFGIARVFDDRKSANTQNFISTGYAPPEQYLRERQTGPVSDVYAFGATLHELLTGRTPISWLQEGNPLITLPPIGEVRPEVSTETETLLARCLKFRISERISSGSMLVEEIAEIERAWKQAMCQCGHSNKIRAVACSSCGRSLLRASANTANQAGPYAWRGLPPLHEVWSAKTGALVRGSVMLFSGTLRVATEASELYEIDLMGKTTGVLTLGGPSRSTPVMSAWGTLIGTKNGLEGPSGSLFEGDEVFSAPLVLGGKIYFVTYGGMLTSISPDGSQQWAVDVRGEGIHPVQRLEGDLLAATKDGVLTRVTTSGRKKWQTQLGTQLYASPIVTDDGITLLDYRGNLRILDSESGHQRAQTQVFTSAYATPGFDGSGWTLASNDGVVVRLDTKLKQVWRQDVGSTVIASPVTAGQHIVVVDRSGVLRLLQTSDGQEIERFNANDEWVAPAVVDGNALFGVTRAGTLHCLVGHG